MMKGLITQEHSWGSGLGKFEREPGHVEFYFTMEVRYRDAEPAGGGVSDAEVESVMKMLMAYQKARAEGVGQPNPELDVNSLLHLLSIQILGQTISHELCPFYFNP